MRARHLLSAALLAAALGAAPAASAEPDKADVVQADKLYKEARKLMTQGKFAAACPKLEESQKLDPAGGTQLQLAACYEKIGRQATALALYNEVADIAQRAGYKDGEKAAREGASKLTPKVPRIVIEVPEKARVPGLSIKRDGVALTESQYGQPVFVDEGDYKIEATATGKKPFAKPVSVKGDGAKASVTIELEDDPTAGAGGGPSGSPTSSTTPPKGGGNAFGTQRIAAVGVAALGVGGIVVGSIFGLDAKPTYDKAINDPSLCPEKGKCYPEGKKLVDQAHLDATISTIGFIAGGVLVAGGVVLFLLAPSGAKSKEKTGRWVTVVPAVGPTSGGAAVVGTF